MLIRARALPRRISSVSSWASRSRVRRGRPAAAPSRCARKDLCLAAALGRGSSPLLPYRDDHRVAQTFLDLDQRFNEEHDARARWELAGEDRRSPRRAASLGWDRDTHAPCEGVPVHHRVEVGKAAGARNERGDANLTSPPCCSSRLSATPSRQISPDAGRQ